MRAFELYLKAREALAGYDVERARTFHISESYAMAGQHQRAVTLLDRAVTLGFYPADHFAWWCPFYEGLRERPDFARVVDRAARRMARFQA